CRGRPPGRIARTIRARGAVRTASQVGRRRRNSANAASLLRSDVFCDRIVAINSSNGGNGAPSSTGPYSLRKRRQIVAMESGITNSEPAAQARQVPYLRCGLTKKHLSQNARQRRHFVQSRGDLLRLPLVPELVR